MGSYGAVVGLLTLAAVVGIIYASLSRLPMLTGIRKRFFCDGKQRVVDVDFVEVNRDKYDVASCTAFAEDQTVSCDKHCVKILEEDMLQADRKGKAPDQARAPQPVFPGNGR